MRVKTLSLKKFKRFDDLTIDLGKSPKKIIALAGPNGCGKSCVFDGLLSLQNAYEQIGSFGRKDSNFFSKDQEPTYLDEITNKVRLEFDTGDFNSVINDKRKLQLARTIFCFRSSYRMSQNLDVTELRSLSDIKNNDFGASHSIDLDDKMTVNYKRLLVYYDNFRKENGYTDEKARDSLLGDLNRMIRNCVNLEIVDLGNILDRRGKIYFKKKDTSRTFDFNLLSSGEKEVVDILLDLFVRKESYSDTIYCIEEPELHLNTGIQRKILIEIANLIPETCQLWISTHSVGFLRALQDELKSISQILDFSEKEYFSGTHTITPIKHNRTNWQRIFQTALDDITGLLAPKRIIYCEGKPTPGPSNIEVGFDAEVYNQIFSEEFAESLFISSGGGGEQIRNSSLALSVLSKAFNGVELLVLKDRDGVDDEARTIFLSANKTHRMLVRREIENYFFDEEILSLYCASKGQALDKSQFSNLVSDVLKQDLKPLGQKIQHLVGFDGTVTDFMIELSKHMSNSTTTYNELKQCIFG